MVQHVEAAGVGSCFVAHKITWAIDIETLPCGFSSLWAEARWLGLIQNPALQGAPTRGGY
jgi:hypothetical protein